MPDFDKNLQPVIRQDSPSDITLNVAPAKFPNVLFTPPNGGGQGDLSQQEDIFSKMDRLSKNRFGEKGIFITNAELEANKRYSSYNPTIANHEDFASYGQSDLDQVANGILKGVNLAATTFGGSLAMLLYGVPKSIFTGKLSAIYDNEASRALDTWNNKVDQEYLPNYKTNKQKDADWYARDNWFTTNFLFDSLVKNAGFAVGAMYSGNLANTGLMKVGTALGQAAMKGATIAEASQAFKLFTPLLRNTSRAFSVGKNIETAQVLEKQISSIADLTAKTSEIAKIANGVSTFSKVNDISRKAAVALYSAAGEASFEALQTVKEFRENLIADYKLNNYGKDPGAEEIKKIDDITASLGQKSFLGNIALLGVTEYFQLNYLMGSSYKNTRRAANSLMGKTGELVTKEGKLVVKEAATKFGKLYDKAKGALTYAIDPKEGFQELGQFALQVGAQNYYNKAYQTNDANVWTDGFLHGFVGKDEVGADVGALNTKEGMESFLLGSITGGLMQAKGTYAENKAIKKNTQNLLRELESTPTYKQAFQDKIDSINRGVILQQQEEEATIQGEELEARDLKDDYMHNYLATRIKYGRFDLIMADLAETNSDALTEEGLAILKQQGRAAVNDTVQSFQKRIASIQESARVIEKLYDSANIRFSGDKRYSPEIIDKLVYSAYKIHSYDKRIPQVNSELAFAGIDTLSVLDDIITKNKPNKEATEIALQEINKKGIEKDDLKTYLSDVVELSLRRKLFLDEYEDIKTNPQNYQTDVDFGASEELDVTVLQKEKGKRKPIEKEIEVGKEYSLKQPVLRQGNKLSLSPKITVLSQTLGGEYQVKLPDGSITFLTPQDFKNYDISDITQNLSPKLEEALNKVIAKVSKKSKYKELNLPVDVTLDTINSLDNKELIDDIQKEFNKEAKELIKKEQEAIVKAERMKLYAEQIKTTQEEISKLSDETPTPTKKEVEEGTNIFESMKKAFQYLFTSTTTASSDFEKTLAPHIVRFNEFMNRAKNFKNRDKLKLVLVHAGNEKELGLEGLAELSFKTGNLDISTAKDPLNGFLGAVFIQVEGNERYFVDASGTILGKVGSKVNLNNIVFSTMPGVNLLYSNSEPRYRAGEKEEATKQAAAYQGFREKLFKSDPSKYNMYDFVISKGINNEQDVNPETNAIGDLLIDENQLDKTLILEVVTKGSIAHEDGNNYKFPNGTVVFRNSDDLTPVYNKQLDKEDAKTIYAVLKALSDEANTVVSKGQNISFSQEYLDFLRNVLFFTDKGKKSNNKIYLSEDKLHIGDNVFDFANIEDHKDQVIIALQKAYYNVNNKTLKEKFTNTFTEFYLEGDKLKKRVWVNYQTYLASSKYPDGSSRKSTPIYTTISKPTDSKPNNFKQKYAILSSLGEEFPQVTKKPEKKEEPVVKGKYTWDGKTKNVTTITLFKGTPQQEDVDISFTGVLVDGVPDITLVEDASTLKSLDKATSSQATVAAAKSLMEKRGVTDEDLNITDPSTKKSSAIYLEYALPYMLNAKIGNELDKISQGENKGFSLEEYEKALEPDLKELIFLTSNQISGAESSEEMLILNKKQEQIKKQFVILEELKNCLWPKN